MSRDDRTMGILGAAAIASGFVLAACGTSNPTYALRNPDAVIGQTQRLSGSRATLDANLVDYGIGLTAARIPAGRVTLVAANLAHDEHELVLIRTDRPAGALSTSDRGLRASEAGKVDEIDSDRPGGAKSTTVTLTPGHYALICNLPGHYHRGMHVDLNVV